jgi:SnoaL-like domain
MPTTSDDRDAIRGVLYRYCFAMDRHLFAELGKLFAADGEWIAPYARATGPAEIAALMERNVPVTPGRMHFTMNSVISLDGDRAEAESNYLVVMQSGAGLVPSVCGIYVDVLTRAPGGWRFRRRELIHHIKGEMGLNVQV